MRGASAKPPRERMRTYRERLRAKGMKPVQIWIPNGDDPELRARIQQQLVALQGTAEDEEDLRWVEAAQDDPECDP